MRSGTVETVEDAGHPAARALLVLLFCASGFAALVYEVVWERLLGIFSGVDLRSITLIVTAYMVGLGVGSLGGGRLADRLGRRRSLLAFVGCEAALAGIGLCSPWLYYELPREWLGHVDRGGFLLPLVSLLLLLPPTVLMGASLPLLSRALVTQTRTAARRIAVLYGANMLGAALGALAAAWWLLGSFGLAGSARIAAGVGLAVAVLALAALPATRRSAADRPLDAHDAAPGAPGSPGFGAWCAVYALSGFLALSLEILWFRTLGVATKSSSFTFGHLLGLFLLMLGLGSLAGGIWVTRLRRPGLAFLGGQWLVTVAAVGLVLLLLRAGEVGWDLLPRYWAGPRAAEISELLYVLDHPDPVRTPGLTRRFLQIYLALPLAVLALPTCLLGFTFAALQRAAQTDLRCVGRRVGSLLAANIAGAILGAVVTGTVLLDRLGTPGSFRAVALLGAVFPVMAWRLLPGREARKGRLAAAAAMLGSVALAVSVPGSADFWARLHGGTAEAVVAMEDATGIAMIHAIEPGRSVFKVSGRVHGVLPFGEERTLYGLVPALLRPGARQAAVVGMGPGNTAWALLLSPSLERLDLFELVRPELDVLRQARLGGRSYRPIEQLLEDPRLHLRFVDGRIALGASSRSYDLIEADAATPSMAYSGNLYSREFFSLCRSRLRPGGLFITMAPTPRVLRTMVSVFPHVLDFHARNFSSFIIGSDRPLRFRPEDILGAMEHPVVVERLAQAGELEETRALIRRYLEQVEVRTYEGHRLPPGLSGDVNTDLFPRDEFDLRHSGTYH